MLNYAARLGGARSKRKIGEGCSMNIIPDKRKLVGLIEQAQEGKLCLPDFQRDFVWKRDEVADLLRSILRQYFIGSLLLLRCDPQNPPFAPVLLRGAGLAYQEPRPELLALDGQQRLTSLLYALTAPDLTLKDSRQQRWFFVDLDLLLTDPYDDEVVFDLSKRELDGLDTPEIQYKKRILPCVRLLRSEDFYNWRDGFEDWSRDNAPEDYQRYREEWRSPWTKAVNNFQTFEVPLVELPQVQESDPESIGRVCAIFEKLNSTGVDLSVYDLLTARLYRYGIRLHNLWKEACRNHKRLNEWSEGKADKHKFGVLVLRTLALLRGLDPKPGILIDLAHERFDEDWRQAAAAMERGLELVENVGPDGFGVFNRKWLPGFALLPVLSALRAVIDSRNLGEGPRSDLRQWYWCNVFMERYSSAVESKSRKDYSEMLRYWSDGKLEPSVFSEASARIGTNGYTVRGSASYASAVYSGVFCLLALRGARDWKRGESIQLQELQDHHIFPRAYLRRNDLTNRGAVNSIVNRTLISDETNALIRDKAPADYISNTDVFPSGSNETLLNPHFLNAEAVDIMNEASEDLSNSDIEDIYGWFSDVREKSIIAEIRKVCIVAVSNPSVTENSEVSTEAHNI